MRSMVRACCPEDVGVMRLLLDTHALLWTLSEPAKLRKEALEAVTDRRNDVFASAASAWEIAIKRALGKLQAPDDLEAGIASQGFSRLNITFRHAALAGALPLHHADPFDRMLVAQAQSERLTLVTRDARIPLYDVPTLAA